MHSVLMGRLQVVRLNNGKCLPGQLFRRITERGQRGRVGELNHTAIIDHQHHVIGGFPERAETFFTIAQRLLGNALCGDVAADSSITGKFAGLVKNRFSADTVIAQFAVSIVAANDEIAERLIRLKLLPVCMPIGVAHRDGRQLPARLADMFTRFESGLRKHFAGKLDEAELTILLPIPVAGQQQQVSEARFTFGQLTLILPLLVSRGAQH